MTGPTFLFFACNQTNLDNRLAAIKELNQLVNLGFICFIQIQNRIGKVTFGTVQDIGNIDIQIRHRR